jgi:signal transduction histidine kinase/CheY-like chemotaxis protein
MRARDGRWRWLLERATVVARDDSGRPTRVSGLVRDISERRWLEEQLIESRQLEAIGRLAGGVAHDFNNLLTSILSAAELAAATLETQHPAAEDLRVVQEAARRAGELTRQLLAFVRRQEVAPSVVDVNAIVDETARMLHRTLGRDVELVLEPCASADRARIDPVQLQQVLVNLAMNARAAMPNGGRLSIATAVGSSDRGDRDRVRIRVSDTGAGMDSETRARAFEPFFTTRERGTGLGLASAYRIVRKAGGRIELDSEPGVGTTVTIDLPRATEVPVNEPSQPRVERGSPGETLLLVEDDPLVLQVTRRVLEDSGYRVIAFQRPDEALALAERGTERVDALVTDLSMPEMTGTELAVRVGAARPGLPTLFLSGHAHVEVPRVGQRPITADFLAKPYTREEMATKVRALLERAERAQVR